MNEALLGALRALVAEGKADEAQAALDPALSEILARHEYDAALELARAAREVEGLHSPRTLFWSLYNESIWLELLGRTAEELVVLDRARALSVEIGDEVFRAWVAQRRGWFEARQARYDEAISILTDALALARAARDPGAESSIR